MFWLSHVHGTADPPRRTYVGAGQPAGNAVDRLPASPSNSRGSGVLPYWLANQLVEQVKVVGDKGRLLEHRRQGGALALPARDGRGRRPAAGGRPAARGSWPGRSTSIPRPGEPRAGPDGPAGPRWQGCRIASRWSGSPRDPFEEARPGDFVVSRPGTVTAARVFAPGVDPFVAVSMYSLWESPHSSTNSSWIVSDASAHRVVSDLSAFIGTQHGHRILAAGDLNILHGHGEGGSRYWAQRYQTVFDRMEALGLEFVGPQAPGGRQADPWPDELPPGSRNVPTYYPRSAEVRPRPPASWTSSLRPGQWPIPFACVPLTIRTTGVPATTAAWKSLSHRAFRNSARMRGGAGLYFRCCQSPIPFRRWIFRAPILHPQTAKLQCTVTPKSYL